MPMFNFTSNTPNFSYNPLHLSYQTGGLPAVQKSTFEGLDRVETSLPAVQNDTFNLGTTTELPAVQHNAVAIAFMSDFFI